MSVGVNWIYQLLPTLFELVRQR